MNFKLKRSLRAKSLLAIILMTLTIGAAATIVSYSVYATTMDNHFKSLAIDVAQTAAIQMDSEDLKASIDAGQPTGNYNQMLKFLRDVQIANQVDCIYILQLRPESGETFTVMDTDPTVPFGAIDPLVETMPVGQDELVYISNTDAFGWLSSSMVTLYDTADQPYAVMCVDISMNNVMADRYRFLSFVLLVIFIVMVVFAVAVVLLVTRFIVNPINQLSSAAGQYISNRKDDDGVATDGETPNSPGAAVISSAISQLEIHTGDEIESLAHSMKIMEQEINEYIEHLTAVTAEKERIGAELNVANHIQASMLPSIFPAFPERPELDIYATMTPAKEVGGDFYDFFLLDDDRLAMVMADVSGKGVPAALFMVIAKTLLKNVAQTGLSPKQVLEKVNNQLCVGNETEMFVTVWLGVMEISTGKLTAANAGHEYPVIKRAGGDFELVFDKHGFVLAGMEGSRYKEYELQLDPGDKLFLYTDGVPEATDGNNELFGTDRMLDTLNRHKDVSCEALLHNVKQDVESFVGSAPQFDDITMLCLERRDINCSMKKLRLTPSLDAMEQVSAFLEQTLEDAQVPMKAIVQMNIAADEIFSNIARYSSASDATIGISITNGVITLRFADNGMPYDPTEKADPDVTLTAEERCAGGLGIYMVKKSMDEVLYEYHDGLNILQLTKKF